MSADLAEAALREALEELAAAGPALRERDRASIAQALVEAWGRIADPERALGRAARERLPARSGLSLPMVAWALSSTLGDVGEELPELARRMEPPGGTIEAPARLGALILAGNVFTACVQPISVALLAKVPVFVKASSADDTLPRLFVEALEDVDPALAAACFVVNVPRGTAGLEATVLHHAQVVGAYGADATLASIRSRCTPNTTFVGHGHGLGLGLVTRGCDLEEAAAAFALDVAAYDQRGCMSPHAIAVDEGVDGARFVRALAEALEALAVTFPRGALPTEVGAAQMQWRGVAAARGSLFEGDGFAVSHEGPVAPRVSPGWRNVMVFEVADLQAFAARAGALGPHLKTVGVAADVEAVARSLVGVAPRVCPAGSMQRPGLLAYADGLPPWEGWRRFITR